MKTIRNVLIFASIAIVAMGQAVVHSNWGVGDSSATITGVTSTAPLTISNSGMITTGDVVWAGSSGRNTWTIGGVSETRKMKNPLPTIQQVKSTGRVIDQRSIASPEYLKLAKSVGIGDSVALEESRVRAAISLHGFKVYDYAAVDDYLYNQALKQGTNVRWVWKPMREADIKAVSESGAAWQNNSAMGMVVTREYAKAIPQRILEDVQCLLTEVSGLIPLVSDYEVVKPDPFLAVTTKKLLAENIILIVDVWNEPGFVEAKQAPAPVIRHDDGKQVARLQ